MMIQPETMQCLWFRELLPENDSYLACTLKWALLSLWKWVNVQEPPVFFKVIASSLFTMIIQCGSKGMSTWKTAWGFIIAHWLDFAQLDIFLFFFFFILTRNPFLREFLPGHHCFLCFFSEVRTPILKACRRSMTQNLLDQHGSQASNDSWNKWISASKKVPLKKHSIYLHVPPPKHE